MGKLAKVANVPVVVMICHGDFIHQPHYNQTRTFKIPLETELKCIVTQEEVATLTADEIQKRIEENFVYDDYQYQFDNHIENKSKYRADNLHRILYKCPHCGKDYSMTSHYTKLWCQECHEEYEMDVYGQLHNKNGNTIFHHVPDWYRWERQEVEKEVKNGTYHFECKVRLEHLSNSKVGFVPLGEVNFVQDYQGLHLEGTLDDGSPFKFDNPSINTPSIHIDYNFKKKGVKKQGQALDINNEQDTYFIYPLVDECVVCKIHFATEALYDLAKEKEDKR
jgi:protein-arginine kinase activator protein McsA